MSADRAASPFSLRAAAILVAALIAGFAGFVLMLAYGDDLRPVRSGGAHMLSTSAVGFSGVAELVRIRGGKAWAVRDRAGLDTPALLILTPSHRTDPKQITEILERRAGLPTLIVLPKWITRPLDDKPAWVERVGRLPAAVAAWPLNGIATFALSEGGGNRLRRISGDDIETVFEAPGGGGALVAGFGEDGGMILADPDALNNMGLNSVQGVDRALRILDETGGDIGDGVAFDVTLNGFGRNPNVMRLAFDPPFLALTLCLLAAAALAVLHALRRFGPALREERAIAFGKRGIAENAAALLRLARRRHRTGGRYAALTRDAAAQATGAGGLTGEALDAYLDRLDGGGEPFSSIAARAADAPDTRRLLLAARDLFQWKRTVTREHR